MTVRKYICKVWSAEGRVPVGLDVAISLVTQSAAHYIFVYKIFFVYTNNYFVAKQKCASVLFKKSIRNTLRITFSAFSLPQKRFISHGLEARN